MIPLRPPQQAAIDATRQAWDEGITSGIIALPTGVGKTITGLSLAVQTSNRVLWLAHREELITQPIRSLRMIAPNIVPGVVKGERNEYGRDFVFASMQTACRPGRIEKLKGFDLVVVDEGHHATSPSYKNILAQVGCLNEDFTVKENGVKLILLTATPERTDATGLDEVAERIIFQMQMIEAIALGYLVQPRATSYPIDINLDSVRTKGGDFDGGQLDTALLQSGIVDTVCDCYAEKAKGKKTIIFTVSVKQAEMIAEQLAAKGVKAMSLSGNTDKAKRSRIIADFKTGMVQVVVNVMVLTEGFDEPSVECIILARPTKSKPLYIQMVGRGLRLFPGKTSCLIVDMMGMSDRHTVIQAPVIFGTIAVYGTKEMRQMAVDLDRKKDHALSVLQSQLKGVAAITRSALRWVTTKPHEWALGAGQAGTVRLRRDGDLYMVDVVGRVGAVGIDALTIDPVAQELAMGIAEDYVRRASAASLNSRNTSWQDDLATDKQLNALRRFKVEPPGGCTKGQAADLMTKAVACDWRNDPPTDKQISALKRMTGGIPEGITKGKAMAIINGARK